MSKYEEDNSVKWWIIGVTVVSLLALAGLVVYNNRPPAVLSIRDLVMSCTTDMATQFHIHPVLSIIINGQKQEIPAEIGITNGCMHPIHTHDNSGTIHVESPEERDFTLGDFFAVWGKTFSKNQILDSKIDDQHVISETVNGKEVQDYENTILRDKDEIVISYGEVK